ncbi:hypothetical protein Q8W71_09615 [Methylobacterium sp. NEAU 140]|uniref:hypothetical protein n=1 Tax=Methylobacterium sp. NEAU 140 TaxID=3064945 RepID=UPI0027342C28|nr:hypothetical protein [Methylobacterium sp. NEAU 140]MDP4022878.1 hypothetical protein [Methylobacterium sp. NEAU 140]
MPRRGAGERPAAGAEPAGGTRPDDGRIDLPVARGRLAGLLAAALAFTAGCAFALAGGGGAVRAGLLGIGLAFFGLGALAALRDLLRRDPVLSVSAYGLFDRRLSTDWIPWSALDWISEVDMGRQGFLCLHPRADRAAALPWTRRARLTAALNRVLGGGYWLPGQGVRGGLPAIRDAVARARRGRR